MCLADSMHWWQSACRMYRKYLNCENIQFREDYVSYIYVLTFILLSFFYLAITLPDDIFSLLLYWFGCQRKNKYNNSIRNIHLHLGCLTMLLYLFYIKRFKMLIDDKKYLQMLSQFPLNHLQVTELNVSIFIIQSSFW